MSEKGNMQIAVHHGTAALTMPTEEFIELQLQPIEDDTWIRQEDIVRMENLVDNEGGEEKKRELLKEYMDEHAKVGDLIPDPILEGMLYQERFMDEYRITDHRVDSDKATYYRRQIMTAYRRKHPNQEPLVPVGEEDTDLDDDNSPKDLNEGEVKNAPNEDKNVETAAYPTEEPAACPTEEPAACPTEETAGGISSPTDAAATEVEECPQAPTNPTEETASDADKV